MSYIFIYIQSKDRRKEQDYITKEVFSGLDK